jgi:CAAX protease family protein
MSGRLVAWLAFVGVQILFNYATRASGAKPSRDAVYQWSAAGGTLLIYAVLFGIVLAISREETTELLALRRPRSWARAAGTAALVIVSVIVLELVLEPFLHANREQSLTPTSWQAAHAGAFAASFVVLVLVGPFVEEATFRGLGFSLLVPYGRLLAILATGVLFGLAHGLVDALPVLVALGVGLGYLRSKTDSLYPGFVLHALFNAVALTLAVA